MSCRRAVHRLGHLLQCLPFILGATCLTVEGSERGDITESLLLSLFSDPLQNRDVFLLHDEEVKTEFVLDEVLGQSSSNSSTTFMLSSFDEFQGDLYPKSYLRGEIQIVILLFTAELTGFLDRLKNVTAWNPSYLILISLSKVLGPRVMRHPVIQRSSFILLFELESRLSKHRFNVFTSYPFRKGGVKHPVASWNQNDPVSFSLFQDRHPSFEGSVLNLASWCDDYPLVYVRESDAHTCVGCNLDLLTIIGGKLNFSFTVEMMSADEKWGSFEDGVWTGMLGDLAYNGRHLTVNYFLVNYERWTNFDSTYPYHAEGFGFMVRRPLPLPQWRSIIYPFTMRTWMAILISMVVVSVLFCLSVLFVLRSEGRTNLFDNMLRVSVGVLSQSGSTESSGWAWQRVWLASFWVGCIILSTAYTGNLIAFLTVPAYPSRVESVAQLAKSHLRLTMQDYGEFVPEAMKKSSDEDLYTIGHKMDLFAVVDTLGLHYQKGVDYVMAGTHALLETYSYLMNVQVVHKVLKETYLMKEQIYSGHLAWFLPLNTPYTPKMSSLLTRLKEVGVVHKLFQDHFRHVTSSAPDTKTKSQPKALGIAHVQGIFLLAIIGFGIAFLSFLVELCLPGKHRGRKESPREK